MHIAAEDGTAIASRPDTLDLAQYDVGHPTPPILLDTMPISRFDAPVAISGELGFVAGDGSFLDVVSLCDSPGLNHSVWLEIAAHNDGLEGSRWRTDLVVRHIADSSSEIQLILRTDGEEHILTDTLEAGAQAVYEDVVGLMQVEGKGTLEVRASAPVAAFARIYNLGDDGTFGQIAEGVSGQSGLRRTESAWILGLRQKTGQFRSNISVANTGSSSAKVRITLFDNSGHEIADYDLPQIERHSVFQEIEPLANRAGLPDVGWATARVTVVYGIGVLASASVIDSRTNDPSTVPMWRPAPPR